MMPVLAGELARRCGGRLDDLNENVELKRFALDSRDVGPGSIFLAVRGARVDGHVFVEEAMQRGAVACMVEQCVPAPSIRVENLVDALACMASTYRDECTAPVVGVTGSAGKTTTKEFLAAALRPMGRIGKTEGNRNTEYSAPLMWAELKGDEAAVVVEMSMRGFGQIAHLATFSRPTIGLITNIGTNHAEKVGSKHGVLLAKAELLQALPMDGLAILWRDDASFEELATHARCPVQTYGWHEDSTARLVDYRPLDWSKSYAIVQIEGQDYTIEVPGAGRHFAQNAAAALLAAVRCGVDPVNAAQSLAAAAIPPMRLELRQWGAATLVMDNYNAAPESFVAAVETLAEVPCSGRRILVAGEMRELGDESVEGHRKLGEAIAASNIDHVLFFGSAMKEAEQAAVENGYPSSRTEWAADVDGIRRAMEGLRQGDTVLVKGSRALEMERAFLDELGLPEASSR